MLGSIDFMHWVGRIVILLGKKYTRGIKVEIYKGHKGHYNVILQAVADYDL
jgi:hypothetical protein